MKLTPGTGSGNVEEKKRGRARSRGERLLGGRWWASGAVGRERWYSSCTMISHFARIISSSFNAAPHSPSSLVQPSAEVQLFRYNTQFATTSEFVPLPLLLLFFPLLLLLSVHRAEALL